MKRPLLIFSIIAISIIALFIIQKQRGREIIDLFILDRHAIPIEDLKQGEVKKLEDKTLVKLADDEVDSLITNGDEAEKTRLCPEILALDNTASLAIGYYGGFEVNGCKYASDKTLKYNYNKPSCSKNIEDELDKQDYSVVNSCLFNKGKRIFEENLLAKIVSGDFGEEYLKTREPKNRKTMGEGADEWFRFEDNDKLYIFLKGGAGCGGCVYNDPYLLIDLSTDDIQLKHGDIPYLPNLFLSPDHKKAIEVEFEQINVSNTERKLPTKLYVFDFLNLKRDELVYEVPEYSTILSSGDGFYPMGISWLDDSTIQVQLFENKGFGTATEFKDENNYLDYIKQGDPVIINVY